MYINLARWCYRHRVFVVVAWVVGIMVVNGVGAGVGTAYSDQFEAIDSESDRGNAISQEYFGGQGSSFIRGQIVVRAESGIDTPEVQGAIEQLVALAEEETLTAVGPFDPETQGRQVAVNGDAAGQIAFIEVEGDEDEISFEDSVAIGERLLERGEELEADIDGLQVEIGGQAFAGFETPESEVIGLAFAVVILIVSFGSVLAMGLPIGVALAGVSVGLGFAGMVSNLTTMPSFATVIGAMIGIGVGIDYALFIVTRYREGLHEDFHPEAATAAAGDTATRAVVFAGATVVVSLLGLLLIGLEFVAGLGIAAAITVAATMLATTTLLPALLGFAQLRIEVTRWRGLVAAGFVAVALLGVGLKVPVVALVALPLAVLTILLGFVVPQLKAFVPRRERRPVEESIWWKWSHEVQRHPWRYLISGTLVLLFLATPVLGLRLAFTDEGNYAEETTTRQAYDLLAEGFGPGYSAPFVGVATIDSPAELEAFQNVRAAIAETDGIAFVSPPVPNDPTNPTAALIQITALTSPQDVVTEDLVRHLRNDVIPAAEGDSGLEVNLTGQVPISIDFSSYLGGRSLLFFGVVFILSFVLLMAVFRSLLVPLKAVIMNALSIAGAYGVVVALFQWGHLSAITGVEPGPVEPFIPMMMFAIVFGLSMDYEVFLLSRVKEEYERTGDAKNSVADGLASTARVITAAAAIMIVVFGAFLLEDDRVTKLMGTGLSVAILLDATLVRMLLVPATMELLGERNWWLPKWLDRVLPSLDVEGSKDHDERIAAVDAEAKAAELATAGTPT